MVDDDAVSRHVLASALRTASLEGAFVGSGSEALEFLARTRPSLVLLDLVMPPPDGYDVLRAIRELPSGGEIPVVVLTALDADDEIARAFEAGADDFLRKPFRPAELVARIRGQLRLRESVETLAQRERDAQTVLELSQALASSHELDDILREVVRRVAGATGVDRCSIVLVGDDTARGLVVASNDDEQLRDLPLDLNQYPEIREALRTGLPLRLDTDEHPLLEALRAKGHAYASLAIVPIVFELRPLGVLFLRSRARASLGDGVIALARTIANTTAIALRNARILKRLRDKSEESEFARRAAERRLEQVERFADVFESAADGILVIDDAGKILFANPRAREIAGVDASQTGGDLLELLRPADRDVARALVLALHRGERPETLDLHVELPGRPTVVVSANGALLREDDALLFTLRDVTRERALDDELWRTKNFLESVIQSSADAIISADLRGTVLLFNGAAERCYGFAAAEVVGKMNVAELYPPGIAQDIMQRLKQSDGQLRGHRAEVVARDGARVPVALSAAIIRSGDQHVGTVGVFTDLRDRLAIEARLSAAREELKQRERVTIIAELAGAAAHELNQPLTVVMGYAELLGRKLPEGTAGRDVAGVIHREAERMAQIVRKIGTLTRYETKSYVGEAKILDLDRASPDAPPSSRRTPLPGSEP